MTNAEISRTIQYCLSVDGFRMSPDIKEKLEALIPILDEAGGGKYSPNDMSERDLLPND